MKLEKFVNLLLYGGLAIAWVLFLIEFIAEVGPLKGLLFIIIIHAFLGKLIFFGWKQDEY